MGDSNELAEMSKMLENDKFITLRLEFLKFYQERIEEILQEDKQTSYYSLVLDLTVLNERFKQLYDLWEGSAATEYSLWNLAANAAQHGFLKSRRQHLLKTASVKENVVARFVNKPESEPVFPTYLDLNRVVQIEGMVNSLSQSTYVQHAAEYKCNRCDTVIVVEAEYHKFYESKPPFFCKTLKCNGQMCPNEKSNFKRYAHSYQELYLEELNSTAKKPRYATATLEDDLVDTCQLGDVVIVVGTVENRQKSVPVGKRAVNKFHVKVNSLRKRDNRIDALDEEQKLLVTDQWNTLVKRKGEFGARDFVIQSFCPDLYCMYIPKLAVLLALASCVEGEATRPHSHVLLVGEPGLAKSKLLERAVDLSARSFFTGGYRVSKVGLTAGVLKIDGEDVYEAGVLPLCDGGIVCIDEFNLMCEEDKAALHEAMEQQTISITKTGVIAKLRSRCAIIAAANPRNIKTLRRTEDDSQINFGIQPALLSRFDIILILRDDCNPEWDRKITRHVMNVECGRLNLSEFWSMEQLKMHLLAARDEKPQVTDDAKKILIAYYQKLLSHTPALDVCRVTARALDGLFRIAKSYCRLLLKKKVMALDAVVVIRLMMENCYGMGAIVSSQFDPVQKSVPLGPSEEELVEVLRSINLFDMIPIVMEQLKEALKPDGNTVFEEHIRPRDNPNQRQSKWNEVLEKDKRTETSNRHLIKQCSVISSQIPVTVAPGPSTIYSAVNATVINQPQPSQINIFNHPLPQPSQINIFNQPQQNSNCNQKPESNIHRPSYYDMDEDELLADILGDSDTIHNENLVPVNEQVDQLMEICDEPQTSSPVATTSTTNLVSLEGNRNTEQTSSDMQPTTSTLSGSLKKLHEQFAYSQAKKRRDDNDNHFAAPSSSKELEKKTKRKTTKSTNTVSVPLDGINSVQFGNILQGVAAAFAPRDAETVATTLAPSKSSINDLIDDSFFDD